MNGKRNRTAASRLARGLAWWIVRLAARRAPRNRRDAMLAEWRAELHRAFASEPAGRVLRDTFGAFADARALHDLEKRTGTTTGEGTTMWIEEMRTAVRGLRRAPGFSALVIATLAVGIGGASAIYALLDRAVIDPLPYPDSDRLVRLENRITGVGPEVATWQLSTAQYVFYSAESATLDEVGLFRPMAGNVTTDAGAVRVSAVRVTASIPRLLGQRARVGRLIVDADDTPASNLVVVLSHDFWVGALGGDPSIVGRTISFSGVPHEVVGVLEPGAELPGLPGELQPDLWTTLRIDPAGRFANNHVFPAIARRAVGRTPMQVEEELVRLEAGLLETFPSVYSEGFVDNLATTATPLKEHVLGDLARNLWILFAGVGLVLLIAAANAANLFIVRVEAKRRELGIRAALGAGRPALARHLVAEGIVVAGVGGVLALAVGYWAIPAITVLAPDDLPRIRGVGIDLGTIAFTVVLSVLVGCLIALLPALESRRISVAETLVDSSRGATSRSGRRARSALVVTQIALALTLLVGAGMLLQSLDRLHSADPGFDPEGVVAVDLHLTQSRYPSDVDLWLFYRTALERIRTIPGVVSAGLGEEVPVSGSFGCTVQGFEEEIVYQRLRDAGLSTCAGQTRVTPGYFEVLGIELVEGRLLEDGDFDDPGRAGVVVSRAAAERFWPGESALGKGIGPARTVAPFHRVVGVVDDVRRASDDGQPPLSQDAIAVYYPVVDNPNVEGNWWWWPGDMTLVVRAEGVEATTLTAAIRSAIFEVDPEIPIANARLMDDVVGRALVQISFVSLLLTLAATVALTLAAVGLYGVVSYAVGRRRREIGMRLAIGARPRAVEGMVVGQTLRLLGFGLLAGLPLAIGISRLGGSLVVGVSETTPGTYAMAVAVMVGLTLAAAWLPARRASALDPVEALRGD